MQQESGIWCQDYPRNDYESKVSGLTAIGLPDQVDPDASVKWLLASQTLELFHKGRTLDAQELGGLVAVAAGALQ
jgi:hypothetical protein